MIQATFILREDSSFKICFHKLFLQTIYRKIIHISVELIMLEREKDFCHHRHHQMRINFQHEDINVHAKIFCQEFQSWYKCF